MLILDNHGSHCTYKFMRLCLENNIILLYLPPHTSHILQPLDLSIFASFKSLYQKAARKLLRSGDFSRITKAEFVQIYSEIRPLVISQCNVASGWRKSGIYPLNSDEPLSTPFMKEQIAREQPLTAISPLNEPEPTRDDPVLVEDRETRFLIRNLERQLAEEQAKTALLTVQLEQANAQIAELSTSKKRKKIHVDSNEKLASFKAIRNTQEAQELERVEEEKRAKRRAKRAKK